MAQALPTVDNSMTLVSHGQTMKIRRDKAAVETYSIEISPYGSITDGWSRDEVTAKIAEMQAKGWEVKR